MVVDQIAVLKLLSDLFLSIAGQLNKLKGTPKQRFAREILDLFDILGRAERNISEIIESLKDFNKAEQIGMRVHYIHRAGKFLEEFSRTCDLFIRWVDHHENLSGALQVLSPKTEEIMDELNRLDRLYTKGNAAYAQLRKTIKTLEENLQAVRSPNPNGFPTSEFVVETIEQFNQILSQIEASKRLLREFATKNLSVEDFF
jgi:DNA repair exonuclease SbcCD ATPase subunit